MSKFKWMLILAALWISACKGATPTIAYTPPVLAEDWSVSMKQSGGIMGLLRFIAADSQGNYRVMDQRTNTTLTGELTQAELSQLRDLVTNLTVTASKNPAVCVDCFVYEVEIQSNGKKMLAEADDISLPDSGLGALVEFLRGKMEAVLK